MRKVFGWQYSPNIKTLRSVVLPNGYVDMTDEEMLAWCLYLDLQRDGWWTITYQDKFIMDSSGCLLRKPHSHIAEITMFRYLDAAKIARNNIMNIRVNGLTLNETWDREADREAERHSGLTAAPIIGGDSLPRRAYNVTAMRPGDCVTFQDFGTTIDYSTRPHALVVRSTHHDGLVDTGGRVYKFRASAGNTARVWTIVWRGEDVLPGNEGIRP